MQRPRAALALVPLATLLLAGCAGGGGGDGAAGNGGPKDGGPGGDGMAGAAGLALPTWAVGDAWTYAFNGEPATYVVTGETSSDWVMETDSAERAFSDLRDDISRLGPQRKSDLAGSQGQDRVEFFRWPLEAGAAWTTRWDGLDVEVRVAEVTADRAVLEAYERAPDPPRDTPLYRYTYDAAAGWFGELHRFAPDGTEVVALLLTDAVHGWTGTVVRWQATTVLEESEAATPAPLARGGPFEVPAGTTDLWAEYHFTCTGTGGYSVVVEPANAGAGTQGMQDGGPCTQVDWVGPIVSGPQPGTWTFLVSAGGETVASHYALLLRTRQDVAFPA